MPHTILTDVCEGVSDCVDACPVACIHPGPTANAKGTVYFWIDFETCIDCGICLQVCPVNGAIVPEERPRTPAFNLMVNRFGHPSIAAIEAHGITDLG